MGRIAKKSDLQKKDLKQFAIGLTEAKALKIMRDDLTGITEIIPDKKYKIRATVGTRKSITFNGTLLDAIKEKKELNNLSEKQLDEKQIANEDLMFMEGVALFIDYCYERVNREEMDINSVFDHVKKIDCDASEFFGKYKLSEINTELAEKFIDSCRKRKNKKDPTKKLSEQTIANNLKSVNAVFNYLVLRGKISSNPFDKAINKPKPKRTKKELNYFHSDEAKYALKCLDKYADIRLKTFMNIIFSLGCRREEASGLRWKDIDFKNKDVSFNYAITSTVPVDFLKETMNICQNIDYLDINGNSISEIDSNNEPSRIRVKALKTDNSYRTNYLSDVAISYLKKYYQFKIACGINVSPDDFIFTTWREGRNVDPHDINYLSDNKPVDPNKLSAQWREFKKLYHIKNVDLHRIRHTVANILEKQGVPKKDIAKMLGNTERVLEEFYTHVDVEDLKRLRNKIDTELFNDIEYIELNIDFVAKIINEYPMELLTEDELKKLDLVSFDKINSDNYLNYVKKAKDLILTNDGSLNYFMDNDANSLKIKIETYKRFSENSSIKIQKEKDISISKDILSF